MFAVALWMYDGYRMYACCILLVSGTGVAVQMIENIQNNAKIREMARYTCDVEMKSGDKLVKLDSS